MGFALGLSGWSENSNQPQATPQYLRSLQLISDSLAVIGPTLWAEVKSWIGLSVACFKKDHFVNIFVRISYYAKKCRGPEDECII